MNTPDKFNLTLAPADAALLVVSLARHQESTTNLLNYVQQSFQNQVTALNPAPTPAAAEQVTTAQAPVDETAV